MSSSDCYACRLNYDDCVYASKASNNERVRHQYCGRNLGRTEYFCCPKVVSRSGVREDVVCGSGDREVCEFLLTGEKFSSDRESASLSQSLWSWILPIIGAVSLLCFICWRYHQRRRMSRVMVMQQPGNVAMHEVNNSGDMIPTAVPVGSYNNPGTPSAPPYRQPYDGQDPYQDGAYGNRHQRGMGTGTAMAVGVGGGLLGGWALNNAFDGDDY